MCGNNGDQSARLELYEDFKSANCASREKSIIRKILFIDVKYVSHTEERQREIITIGMQGSSETFLFYANTQQRTMKWYRYCSVLMKIPKCTIPEIPIANVALQLPEISQYGELHKCDTGSYVVSYAYDIYTCTYIGTYYNIHCSHND